MGRKVARSLSDAIRYRMQIVVNCGCGHEARITARALYDVARARKQPNCLHTAMTRLKCSKCGERGPRWSLVR